MGLSAEELRNVMARKTDEELYDVVHAHAPDYTAEAIEAAKRELSSRNLDVPRLTELGTVVAGKLKQEDAPLEWPMRIVAFFISTMFLFIPLVLAHRHYVERGARRKARDWARWAGLGFVFYLFAAVSLRIVSQLSN